MVDIRRLLELDEQRRRAEADKMAAIRALEARSLEFMHEKEEKKRSVVIGDVYDPLLAAHHNFLFLPSHTNFPLCYCYRLALNLT